MGELLGKSYHDITESSLSVNSWSAWVGDKLEASLTFWGTSEVEQLENLALYSTYWKLNEGRYFAVYLNL